jgi:hypothetical protein
MPCQKIKRTLISNFYTVATILQADILIKIPKFSFQSTKNVGKSSPSKLIFQSFKD